MKIAERPTDMLLRQMYALRKHAQFRHPETGRRGHGHESSFRAAFVTGMLELRTELRKRGIHWTRTRK